MTKAEFIATIDREELLGDMLEEIREVEGREPTELEIVSELAEEGHPNYKRWLSVFNEQRELTEDERSSALCDLRTPL